MNRTLQAALSSFKRCAEEAPAGTYEQAKELEAVIGDACDNLMREVRALGLKADACDRAFALEAAMYEYVRGSNPDATVFPLAEGFGDALDGPARERVLEQTIRNRDFLAATIAK